MATRRRPPEKSKDVHATLGIFWFFCRLADCGHGSKMHSDGKRLPNGSEGYPYLANKSPASASVWEAICWQFARTREAPLIFLCIQMKKVPQHISSNASCVSECLWVSESFFAIPDTSLRYIAEVRPALT